MRFYITLNEDKEKDKLIIELLNKQYNAKDYVTALLYQYATSCTDLHLSAPKQVESDIKYIESTVKNAPICIDTEQNPPIAITDDLMKFFTQ